MSNAISSMVFAYRNVGKTERGEIGRAPVAVAQSVKVLDKATVAASKYDKVFADTTQTITSVFSDLSKESKVLDKAVKVTKWATKNVNPLICASGVLKTLMSDDKLTTGITETAALSTMFLGERTTNKLLKKASEHQFKNKILEKAFSKTSKIGVLLHGLLFVCASIGSYAIGEHLGKDIAKEFRPNKKNVAEQKTVETQEPKKINQMA